jgi:hypothetical protein
VGKYKFIGTEPRVFPDFALEVEPGDVHEFEDDPPGGETWWASAPAKAKVTEEKES